MVVGGDRAVALNNLPHLTQIVGVQEGTPGGGRGGRNWPIRGVRSVERQVFHDAMHITGGYQSHFTQVTLTLPVLAFGKVTTTLFPAQNFAGSSDLEAFRDALSRFTAGYFLSHRGPRI